MNIKKLLLILDLALPFKSINVVGHSIEGISYSIINPFNFSKKKSYLIKSALILICGIFFSLSKNWPDPLLFSIILISVILSHNSIISEFKKISIKLLNMIVIIWLLVGILQHFDILNHLPLSNYLPLITPRLSLSPLPDGRVTLLGPEPSATIFFFLGIIGIINGQNSKLIFTDLVFICLLALSQSFISITFYILLRLSMIKFRVKIILIIPIILILSLVIYYLTKDSSFFIKLEEKYTSIHDLSDWVSITYDQRLVQILSATISLWKHPFGLWPNESPIMMCEIAGYPDLICNNPDIIGFLGIFGRSIEYFGIFSFPILFLTYKDIFANIYSKNNIITSLIISLIFFFLTPVMIQSWLFSWCKNIVSDSEKI